MGQIKKSTLNHFPITCHSHGVRNPHSKMIFLISFKVETYRCIEV
jgi:hypothetical protein